MSHDTEPNIQDVLMAMSQFSTHVDDQFRKIDDRFSEIDDRFSKIDDQFSNIDDRFSKIDHELVTIKNTMVTKWYLDDKLSDLKGELIGLVRREDQKMNTVVTILNHNEVLSANDLNQINQIKVFAKKPTV